MKRGPRKPAFVVRQGSVAVVGYKYQGDRYCLVYHKHAGAKRSRKTVTGLKAARDLANDIAIALANGRAEILELTLADRESYLHAKTLLDGSGVPLHEAVGTFLHGRTKRSPSAPLTQIYREFIRAKETSLGIGDLSAVHVKNLRDDLSKFVADFEGPIGQVWTDQLQDWLNGRCDKRGKPVSPRRRRNIRARVVSLFNYARDNGYLPLNEKTAIEKTACPKITKQKEPTFEPEQFDLLINAAHLDKKQCELVPAFAIGAFGRMRMSEIGRLYWTEVHLFAKEKPGRHHPIAGEIDVSPKVAGKTGMARIIEIPPNLAKWLQPYMRASGQVLNPKITRIDNHVRRFAAKLGLKWLRNILRGSSTSYLYSLTNDLQYVAAQHGTSERELKREYLERKTYDQAKAWSAIAPRESDDKVLELRWALRE